MQIKATKAVAEFNCLQSDCPDTCCKGWSMQLDNTTFEKYKGTELENAVAHDGKYGEIRVMKRDPQTDYCVKFTDGICAIHKDYGAPRLGDACNFYPRVTRKFGAETIMTASLSCPEIARLSLFTETSQDWTDVESERVPYLNDYTDDILNSEQSLKIHLAFLDACNSKDSPAQIMARIYSVSQSLARIDKKDWPDATGFFLKTADGRLAKPLSEDNDKFKILQIFAAVLHATGKKPSSRLLEIITKTESRLGAKIDWQTLELKFSEVPPQIVTNNDHILHKYISAQLSFNTFPFAGLGETMTDKARLICYKFALTKLLITGLEIESEIIQAIQSAARIIDHIASPQLIFNLMENFGWNNEARIIGLLN